MNIDPDLVTHRARGCPFIANVDGEDFVIDGFAKYKGYGDECKTIYFAGDKAVGWAEVSASYQVLSIVP